MIATSKEEQFNYLLCHDPRSRKNRTFRISRLNDVFITSKTFEIDEDMKGVSEMDFEQEAGSSSLPLVLVVEDK